jgi:hypothetical protein
MYEHPYGPQWTNIATTNTTQAYTTNNYVPLNGGDFGGSQIQWIQNPVPVTYTWELPKAPKEELEDEEPLAWLDRRVEEITSLLAA